MTIAEWGVRQNLSLGVIASRLKQGWSERDALTVRPGGREAARSQATGEQMGVNAFFRSAKLDDNPFRASSMRFGAWVKGWKSAAAGDETDDGE